MAYGHGDQAYAPRQPATTRSLLTTRPPFLAFARPPFLAYARPPLLAFARPPFLAFARPPFLAYATPPLVAYPFVAFKLASPSREPRRIRVEPAGRGPDSRSGAAPG